MTEIKKKLDTVPQLVSITPVSAEGMLTLRKAVRQHLWLDGKRKLYLETTHEIILSAKSGRGKPIEIDSKNRICLPNEVLKILGIKRKTQVGLVKRGNAVAIKAFKIIEEMADRARFIDIETDNNIVRKVETNPAVEQFLPMLVERCRNPKGAGESTRALQSTVREIVRKTSEADKGTNRERTSGGSQSHDRASFETAGRVQTSWLGLAFPE